MNWIHQLKTSQIYIHRMSICKAIVQEGPRKGQRCTFNLQEDEEYCGRHLRNKLYNEGITEGHRWCRFFFRGCNNQLDNMPIKIVSCNSCIEKKRIKKPQCQHSGCTDNAKDGESFCGRHERDKYRLDEQARGVRYCDIARGCFILCEKGLASCNECLAKERERDTERHAKNTELNTTLIENTKYDKRICSKCGGDFEKFTTHHNKESTKCKRCFEAQSKAEKTRATRYRNFKEEKFNNLEYAYKEYINNAIRRGLELLITFDEFSALVTQNCYYCDYKKEGETNGIDRINNDIGYITSNCVSCCETCNYMKAFYHPLFFVNKAKILTNILDKSPEFYKQWNIYYARSINNCYITYKRESEEKRKLPFHLTETEWAQLTRQPCYLCGYSQKEGVGIDRVDNTIREYKVDNCKPCCASCNAMKSDMELIPFLKHLLQIANKWTDTKNLETIPMFSNPYKVNIIIDPTTNAIQEPEKKARSKWNASALYYAILSNTECEFVEFNKEVVTEDEMTILSTEIRSLEKENAVKQLATYINTVRIRRARNHRAASKKASTEVK